MKREALARLITDAVPWMAGTPIAVESIAQALESAWPPRDCVAKLVAAVEHLKNDHDCDTHGHEEIWITLDIAKRWLAASPAGASPVVPPSEEKEKVWAIFYEDQNRVSSPDIFTGAGAEEAARRTFADRKVNWTCYLLCSAAERPPLSGSGDWKPAARKALWTLFAMRAGWVEPQAFVDDVLTALGRISHG